MTGWSTRREFLAASLGLTALGLALASGTGAQAPRPPARTACSEPAVPTPPQPAGPYFKPGSPARASLVEPGMPGVRLVLTGRVVGTDCRPVPGTRIEFWQADASGQYDNAGYRLRGHQVADAEGRYRLETVVPGMYPGRPPHIHVRVEPPQEPALTTQLYFPAEAANRRDWIWNRALEMQVEDSPAGKVATFDFVLDRSRRR